MKGKGGECKGSHLNATLHRRDLHEQAVEGRGEREEELILGEEGGGEAKGKEGGGVHRRRVRDEGELRIGDAFDVDCEELAEALGRGEVGRGGEEVEREGGTGGGAACVHSRDDQVIEGRGGGDGGGERVEHRYSAQAEGGQGKEGEGGGLGGVRKQREGDGRLACAGVVEVSAGESETYGAAHREGDGGGEGESEIGGGVGADEGVSKRHRASWPVEGDVEASPDVLERNGPQISLRGKTEGVGGERGGEE